jgi:hypothetical protein
MNLICKLLGHKTITKRYGNMYGSGDKTTCLRCKHKLLHFEKKELHVLSSGQ